MFFVTKFAYNELKLPWPLSEWLWPAGRSLLNSLIAWLKWAEMNWNDVPTGNKFLSLAPREKLRRERFVRFEFHVVVVVVVTENLSRF